MQRNVQPCNDTHHILNQYPSSSRIWSYYTLIATSIQLVERLTLSNINTLFSDPANVIRERERERERIANAHTSSQNGCKYQELFTVINS